MRVETTDRKTDSRKRSQTFDDDEDTLIQTPEQFEDYDEFSGDGDAPDDRRQDPLRRIW
ncbi:MAG TPA: hypothetical protein VGS96_18045 [Thermoanaerobaculia bacterium]|jgi:hypothetical protein|nr:hypothetical protein [Thermoanaerobaculia bacterium]